MPVDHVRDAAIDVLLRVFDKGDFLDQAVDKKLSKVDFAPRGKRFFTHLVYGTVRHAVLCDHVLKTIVKQPLASLPRPIITIMRMGIFQSLFSSQVTFPAMVHTSVELAHKKGHAGTAKLVNACLRRAPKSLDEITLPSPEEDLPAYLACRYSMPRWLVDRWIGEFGADGARGLCEVSNEETEGSIRCNTLLCSMDELIKRLDNLEFKVEKRTIVPEELTLTSGGQLSSTPVFREGLFFQQDPASMLPSHLLQPEPGDRVLDMCAAPGGKATHLAQLSNNQAMIVASDLAYRRLRRLRENTVRLETSSVQVMCGDAKRPPFKPGSFSKVLVDAPCSGLGTLRRHPDLKLRLQPTESVKLAVVQRALLQSAVELCENQGVLVYSVCTFTPEETIEVRDDILARGNVRLEDGPEWMSPWRIGQGQYRTLPSVDGVDGCFLMRLRKCS